MIGAPQSFILVANQFERSTETISRKFLHMSDIVNRLAADVNVFPQVIGRLVDHGDESH